MASQTNHRKLIVFIGGSSGLGYSALETLISSGAAYSIVLGSRAPLEPWRYGQLESSLQSTGSTLDRIDCDLARYESVIRFADTVKEKYSGVPIEALVLCAGKASGHSRHTVDGEEETLQVNALTHALLIDLLESKLGSESVPCRVLLVSSSLHRKVPERTVNPGNIDTALTINFVPMEVYQITKLLQVFLMYIAQERFEAEKRNITVVTVTPGFVPDTGLARELGLIQHTLMRWVLPKTPLATTMADGGRTICRGITQNFPSGTYFSQRKIEETAEETYDPHMREEWKQWFIRKRVWHQDPVAPPPVPEGPSRMTSYAPADDVSTEQTSSV